MQLRFNQEEQRLALIADDVEQLEITGLKAQASRQSPELIRLIQVKDAAITESRSLSPLPVFLSVYGQESANITLRNNFTKNAKRRVFLEKRSMEKIIE